MNTEAPEVPPDLLVAMNPIGPDVRSAWGPEGRATASFSACGQYRYRLSRVWDPALPRVAWCMLNPSTATELKLDATLTRCFKYSKAWGYGAFEVVNIFAFRAREPEDMRAASDPVGPYNNEALLAAAGDAELVIAGWGTHGAFHDRGKEVAELFADAGVTLTCMRRTKHGFPEHPLYLPKTLRPARYEAA